MFTYMSHIVLYLLAIICEFTGVAFFKLGYGIPSFILGIVSCLAGIVFFIFGILEGLRRGDQERITDFFDKAATKIYEKLDVTRNSLENFEKTDNTENENDALK